jgi:multisubunit Na+/H+ antiporter MnhB subunit
MSSQSSSSGIGFTGMLQILFIGLKLTHYISWHWWQVFLPTLIPLGIVGVILIVWLVVVLIGEISR